MDITQACSSSICRRNSIPCANNSKIHAFLCEERGFSYSFCPNIAPSSISTSSIGITVPSVRISRRANSSAFLTTPEPCGMHRRICVHPAQNSDLHRSCIEHRKQQLIPPLSAVSMVSSSSILRSVSRAVSRITPAYPVSAANGENCAARSLAGICGRVERHDAADS